MATHPTALSRTPAFVTPPALQNQPHIPPAFIGNGLGNANPVAMQGHTNRLGTNLNIGTHRQAHPMSRLSSSSWISQGTRSITALRAQNDDQNPPTEPDGSPAPLKDVFDVGYQPLSGTSMATPHVTAVVADMLCINPNLKVDDVRCILMNSSIPGDKDPRTGDVINRMDHYEALVQAKASLTTPIKCPPKPLPTPKPKQDDTFIPERNVTSLTKSFDDPAQARKAASGYKAAHNVVANVDNNDVAIVPKQVMIRVGRDLAKQSFDKISNYLNDGLEDCQGPDCQPLLRVTGKISPTVVVATVESEGHSAQEVKVAAHVQQKTVMKMVCDTLPSYPGVEAIEADVFFPESDETKVADNMVSGNDEPNSPADPLRPQQWALNPTEEFGIGTDAAKGFMKLNGYPTPREAGIHIGVGDTGSGEHPDMEGVFLPGRRFDRSNYPPTDSIDRTTSVSHGVHVAGTSAAITGNNIGIEGVTDAKILPAKVLSDQGSGSLVDIILGIRWMAGLDIDGRTRTDTPARVINLSLGYQDACSQFLQDTINEANEKGVIIVVAAGNSDIDAGLDCPSNCRNVITVGAHDSEGKRASFSNHGPIVDVYAPGVNIIAPTHRKAQAKSPGDTPEGPNQPKPPRAPSEDAPGTEPNGDIGEKPGWRRIG